MAAVINASIAARVAAPKVRLESAWTARASASRAFPGRTTREHRIPLSACQHPNLACRTYLTPSAAPLLHPQRVAARRTFFGKGVAGLAPVRYV